MFSKIKKAPTSEYFIYAYVEECRVGRSLHHHYTWPPLYRVMGLTFFLLYSRLSVFSQNLRIFPPHLSFFEKKSIIFEEFVAGSIHGCYLTNAGKIDTYFLVLNSVGNKDQNRTWLILRGIEKMYLSCVIKSSRKRIY